MSFPPAMPLVFCGHRSGVNGPLVGRLPDRLGPPILGARGEVRALEEGGEAQETRLPGLHLEAGRFALLVHGVGSPFHPAFSLQPLSVFLHGTGAPAAP